MVLEQVPHHQDAFMLFGQFDKLCSFVHVQSHGLFDVHVLSSKNGLFDKREMGLCRGGDDHGLNIRAAKHLII